MPNDISTQEDLAPDEDARNRSVIEALLIVSDVPLGTNKLASVLDRRKFGAKEVRTYVDDLNLEYAETGRSFRITEIAGGFQFTVHPEFAPWIRQLMREKRPPRLSHASLETLAIVAFKQPLTKAEVEHIRGVAVDGVIRQLLEKELIRISGRSESPGRPLLYGTTRDFLKHFGLKTLSDLPKVRELEELLKEEEERRASETIMLDEVGGAEGPSPEVDEAAATRWQEDADNPSEDGEPKGEDEGEAEPVSGSGGDRFPAGERPTDSSGADSG